MRFFRVLLLISLRNIVTHQWKSLIVGGIIFVGTLVVVVGTSIVNTIQHTMAQSVTASIAGHLQVYDANARDPLALFGSGFMGAEDIGRIRDFAAVKTELSKVDNVEVTVPMGLGFAMASTGNELDRILENLRTALAARDERAIDSSSAQIRQMSQLLTDDYTLRRALAKDPKEIDEHLSDLERLRQDAFWKELAANPAATMQWLDSTIAPLADSGQMFYVRYLGTDLDTFARYFDRFEIVKGEEVPHGQRGILLNERFYEEAIKHKVARDMDAIQKAISVKRKKIATDELLKARVKSMSRQYTRITLQLDPDEAEKLEAALRKELPEEEGELSDLVQAFLTVNDDNFADRYYFFYDTIAPMIDLYAFDIGDEITLRSMTQSGYLKSVNVKIYGTFHFKGLEGSDLAGSHNLVDMMTFRDLYGLMTEEKRKELDEIRKDVGVEAVARESAEDALFGGGDDTTPEISADTSSTRFDEFARVDLSEVHDVTDAKADVVYSQEEIDSGVALNAAVILKDPAQLRRTQFELKKLFKDDGLDLQAVDWTTASGMVGQFLFLIWGVLLVSISVIILVALVIINNTMVMSTMDRIGEIGTLRAIGARRRVILYMVLVETIVLIAIAGTVGALGGAGAIRILAHTGIPATKDILIFLFSGPRLYPVASIWNFIVGGVIIAPVTLLSTLYPAWIAVRVQPIVAMRGKE